MLKYFIFVTTFSFLLFFQNFLYAKDYKLKKAEYIMEDTAKYVQENLDTKDAAVVNVLNRGTGNYRVFTIPVGVVKKYKDIYIKARICYGNKPTNTDENIAFLEVMQIFPEQVLDKREFIVSNKNLLLEIPEGFPEAEDRNHIRRMIFSGWMYSKTPSLSVMKHPDYYIQIKKCTNLEKPEEKEEKEKKEEKKESWFF